MVLTGNRIPRVEVDESMCLMIGHYCCIVCCSALVEYLLGEDVMSAAGYGIGLRDLVLCEVRK